MKKTILKYTSFLLICLVGSGCASNMQSNKVTTNPTLPNVSTNSVNVLVPQQDMMPAVTIETLTSFINSFNKSLAYAEARDIADAILKSSNKHRVNYRVITALVAIESGFRPQVTSSSGAMGLGQLMPVTARSLNVAKPYDPYDNLNGAVRLVRSHLEKYNGDINFALAAYKMGGGTVSRNGISQPSTIMYIKNIRKIYDRVP